MLALSLGGLTVPAAFFAWAGFRNRTQESDWQRPTAIASLLAKQEKHAIRVVAASTAAAVVVILLALLAGASRH